MDKIIWWKLKAKFRFPRFWQKVALSVVYATFLTDIGYYFILYSLHRCQAHATGTFNILSLIPHINQWKHLLHGNPMDEVCLSDWQQQLLWSLGPGEGLRLNAFPQIRALSPGWSLHSWGLGKEEGAPQRGITYQRELSGCQTALLSFLIHQSITIQWCY